MSDIIYDGINQAKGIRLLKDTIYAISRTQIEKRKTLAHCEDLFPLVDFKALEKKTSGTQDELRNNKVWLIRPSSQPGALAVDYACYKEGGWDYHSIRVGLIASSWTILQHDVAAESIKGFMPVKLDMDEDDTEVLLRFLASGGFYLKMLQTRTGITIDEADAEFSLINK